MAIVTCTINRVGAAPLLLKLDLDEKRLNERPILESFQAGILYEPDVANVLVRVLAEGDVVADVGANSGFFTILASALVGPKGHVVAFEPGADSIARLRANLALNECHNVTVIEKAVTSHVGEVEFFLNSGNSGGNAMWDIEQWPGYREENGIPTRIAVPATTLDATWKELALPPPKMIKVDAEGADQRVLEGARGLLAESMPPFVIVELHPFALKHMGCSEASLRAVAEDLGYSTFSLNLVSSLPRLIPAATRIQHNIILNLLFSKPEWVGPYWPVAVVDPHDPR